LGIRFPDQKITISIESKTLRGTDYATAYLQEEDMMQRQLLSQLTKFGLNPSDWQITSVSRGRRGKAQLVNRDDPSFILSGYYLKQKFDFTWDRMVLESL
jgi:hypothetical protein